MPTKGPVPWPIMPHTSAKHEIYETYLKDWFEILMRGQNGRPVTYAEGFSGPGVYTEGEHGSPVLAIRALLNSAKLRESSKVARFVFVDDDPRCVSRLSHELQKEVGLVIDEDATTDVVTRGAIARARSVCPVQLVQGQCSEHLEEVLSAAGAWGQPIFANLDSWGNNPVPFHLLRRIANNSSSEVMVTLKPQHFIRFVETEGDKLDEVFGHSLDWRDVARQDPGAKRRFLLHQYRLALYRAGFEFVLDFELGTANGDELYLVYGTRSFKGLTTMKRALWSVDPNYGSAFRDPQDSMNMPLFAVEDVQDNPLQRFLLHELRARGPRVVPHLQRAAVLETVYREQHVYPALEKLLAAGRIRVSANREFHRGSMLELSEHAS